MRLGYRKGKGWLVITVKVRVRVYVCCPLLSNFGRCNQILKSDTRTPLRQGETDRLGFETDALHVDLVH